TASLEHLLELGFEQIAQHDQALVERLIAGLPERYRLVSPRDAVTRSTLVLVSHEEKQRNAGIAAGLQQRGIDIALRNDKLRFSPHVYNSAGAIDDALQALAEPA